MTDNTSPASPPAAVMRHRITIVVSDDLLARVDMATAQERQRRPRATVSRADVVRQLLERSLAGSPDPLANT